MIKFCKVPKCHKKYYAKSYCRKHYSLFSRTGSAVRITLLNKGKTCRILRCTEPADTKGLCITHYNRFKSHGSFEKRKNFFITNPPRGKKNVNWKGGVSMYASHYHLKKNRLKKLKKVGWKCEICEEPARRVVRKDNTQNNHSVGNLKALCTKCFYARNKGMKHKTSKYLQLYGMTLKEMSEKFGYEETFYASLHQADLLKTYLKKQNIKNS